MDTALSATIQKRIEHTVQALRKNRFEAHYIPTKEELLAKVAQLMPEGCSCAMGGSVTLNETGVAQFLESGGFTYYASHPGADEEQRLKAMTCDVYLTSANAITLDGKLYNVDGLANRVAAICFGPKKVIVVAGYNKIVTDIPAARKRVREIAAPANVARLDRKNPCAVIGVCQDCASPQRICCQELTTAYQRIPGRICVLIVGEQYGY